MADADEPSILDKLDAAVPANLTKFDAFPKLPSTYKQRSESRGLLTLVIGVITFFLILHDIGEFIWGWPDFEFGVDTARDSYLNVNVDLVVNMPCRCESTPFSRWRDGFFDCDGWVLVLSVDLRDAVGDRLYLSKSFRRDGVSNFIPFLYVPD